MTYQPCILAGAVHFSACKIVQLLDKVWPVAGDFVVRFMAKSVYGLNGVTACIQAFKQLAVSAARKTVAVRKNNQRRCRCVAHCVKSIYL